MEGMQWIEGMELTMLQGFSGNEGCCEAWVLVLGRIGEYWRHAAVTSQERWRCTTSRHPDMRPFVLIFQNQQIVGLLHCPPPRFMEKSMQYLSLLFNGRIPEMGYIMAIPLFRSRIHAGS